MLPIIQALKAAGNRVLSVMAGRSKDLIILEDKVRESSDEVIIMTDDGSYGEKGVVTVEFSPLPAVLYGDTNIVDSDGNFLHPRRLSPPEDLTWKSFRQGMLVCHQAFYARIDFAIATPYDQQYRYSADVDWCIRVMKAAAKEVALGTL